MAEILIIGAGAIGRGFLPWCLPKEANITFIDSSLSMVEQLRSAGSYRTFMSRGGLLEPLKINPRNVFHVSECHKVDLSSIHLAFIAVGPRNIETIPTLLGRLNCPIFSLENDPVTVYRLREILKKEDIYFGIPDVITSSTASPENTMLDCLSLHTEDGVLYLTNASELITAEIPGIKAVWSDESKLSMEWDAKLYIHNTPHCIAAYLGHIAGQTYLHEAMKFLNVSNIVEGVIQEILLSLKYSGKYPSGFLQEYADKELARFHNTHLFDPISRVARQPLRKLRPAPHGRLIGAIDLCLLAGVYPKHLLTGIAAALHYDNKLDDDYQTLSLIHDYGISSFLWHFLSISPDSLVSKLVSEAYESFDLGKFQ
jgi:mannitol-1-phosphate 5-dehydrogenase